MENFSLNGSSSIQIHLSSEEKQAPEQTEHSACARNLPAASWRSSSTHLSVFCLITNKREGYLSSHKQVLALSPGKFIQILARLHLAVRDSARFLPLQLLSEGCLWSNATNQKKKTHSPVTAKGITTAHPPPLVNLLPGTDSDGGKPRQPEGRSRHANKQKGQKATSKDVRTEQGRAGHKSSTEQQGRDK